MENRRLDLDSKLNKVQKAKKEKPELEEDMRASQVKYDDSLSDVFNKMVFMLDEEVNCLAIYILGASSWRFTKFYRS